MPDQRPGDQVAWILLGLIFSGLLIALINGGWTGHGGAQDWFKAKFLGKPPSAASVKRVTVPVSRVGPANVPGGTAEASATAGEMAK